MLKHSSHPLIQPVLSVQNLILNITDLCHCQFCRCRRGRCPQIRHIINDRGIRLVSNRRNNGNRAVEYCLCHHSLVERPQILNGAAPTSHDHDIHALSLQCTDSVHNGRRRRSSLYQRRIQNNLHEGIPSGGDLYDIPDCRAGICRDYPKSMDILRNLLLILRSKHALFRQFPF